MRFLKALVIGMGVLIVAATVALVVLTFASAEQQEILAVPVLYSLFIVITSSIVTMYFRRISEREALARDRAKEGSVLAT